ncbi:hypothetical protein FLX56_13655 [Synechococcus moorigangaii CMS01]|nr:hypothetical protein [Synechococcus moorigangaii CMS01]
MTPPAPLKAIIGELEQHPDAQRIKKLLVYTAVNRWESDPHLLQRLSLGRVIQKNLDQFPSLQELQRALSTSVGTLSRPATYGRLANDILTHLSPLYADQDPSTGLLSPPTEPNKTITGLHLEVAVRTLEEHRETIRIKKLLYALCFQRWENDFQVLEAQPLATLLGQLVTLYPSRQRFEVVLQKLVSLLNRQQTYQQLASVILEAIAPLYPSKDAATGLTQPTDDPGEPAPITPAPPPKIAEPEAVDYKQTMAFNIDQLATPHASPPAAPEPSYKETMAFNFGEQAQASQVAPTMVINPGKPLPLPDLPTTPPPKKQHFAADLNIYELKLEVMKYANPLRTKILLFSAVHHPFDLSGKDWSMLRTCDFDELLSEALRDASSLKALEIKLSAIARSLFDTNEHLQSAEAIIQAIKLLTNFSTAHP